MIRSCAYCRSCIHRAPWQMRTKSGKVFCDSSCSSIYLGLKPTPLRGSAHHLWTGGPVQTPCTRCGTPVTMPRAQFIKRAFHFCSFRCRGTWYSENYSGSNSPQWRGGKLGKMTHYGPLWRRRSTRILSRDRYECRRCKGRATVTDHFVPLRLLFGRRAAHASANLLALCKSCHATKSSAERAMLRGNLSPLLQFGVACGVSFTPGVNRTLRFAFRSIAELRQGRLFDVRSGPAIGDN